MAAKVQSTLTRFAGKAGLLAFCSSLSITAGSGAVHAQDAANEASDDVIIVSARRRD
jgi:hypothetical protein